MIEAQAEAQGDDNNNASSYVAPILTQQRPAR